MSSPQIGSPAPWAPRQDTSPARRTTIAASAPRPAADGAAITIGIHQAKVAAPTIGTGASTVDRREPAPAPDLVMMRLEPVPMRHGAAAAKGVMAYATQAAERAQAKAAISLPAALIEVA